MLLLPQDKGIVELLELTCCIPPYPKDFNKFPWWEKDSQLVYDLICSSVCAELVPSNLGKGCGRKLWLNLKTRALEKHEAAIYADAGLKDPRLQEPSTDDLTQWREEWKRLEDRFALSIPYFERIKEELLKTTAAKQRLTATEIASLLEAGAWEEEVASRRSADANNTRRHHHWAADLECHQQANPKRQKVYDLGGDNSSDDSD